jgi:hypothetical protein
MSRDTVEGHMTLEVRYLQKQGILGPGLLHYLSWTRGGEPTGSITINTAQDMITLIYSCRMYGRNPEQVKQNIYLTWTSAYYGGRRPWFLSGNCGQRVAILYGAGKYFACRKCYDLTYRSCKESDKRVSELLRNPAALEYVMKDWRRLGLAIKALDRIEKQEARYQRKRGGPAESF